MRFLPVVLRELRVAARPPRTYRQRWLMVLAMLGLSVLVWITTNRSTPSWLGNQLFFVNSVVLFIASLCYGFVTADSLSVEKREGTLGLLFLTDLRGSDLVFGKLFFSSLFVVYGLLAAFPVLALPLVLGGVSVQDFVRVLLVILDTAFFSLAAGMFVSSLSRHARRAMVGTAALIFFFLFGLPFLEIVIRAFLGEFGTGLSFDELLGGYLLSMFANPLYLWACARGGPASGQDLFWALLVCVHLMGWLLLALAGIILPRNWKDSARSAKFVRWMERLKRWSLGQGVARVAHRIKVLALNPVCWLDDRYRLQKSLLWGALLSAITFWM